MLKDKYYKYINTAVSMMRPWFLVLLWFLQIDTGTDINNLL